MSVRLTPLADFDFKKSSSPGFSYSQLARRIGFASRNYPRDIISGQKRITLQSVHRFARALGLKGDLKTYFYWLVAREEIDLNQHNLTGDQIEEKLRKLRNRIDSRKELGRELKGIPFEYKSWFEIYAALGTPETGATVDEVSSRSGYSTEHCQKILTAVEKLALVKEVGSRYRALSFHVSFDRIGHERQFQKYYLEVLDRFRRLATVSFHKPDRLFFVSAVSIRKERLPEFKEELRVLLSRFMESCEDPQGDQVVNLIAGFSPKDR